MKDVSIIIRETRMGIANLLNSSGLPIDVMDLLLGEIKAIVHSQAEENYLMIKNKQEASKDDKEGR